MQKIEKESEDLVTIRKQHLKKKLVTLFIALIILVILIFVGISFYIYFKSPEQKLSLGANIEEVRLSQEKDVVYIKLAGGINYGNITKIKFIFKDAEGNEYNYETSEGASEISVSFKRGFWQWLFGKQFEGKYDYEINASDLELNNFNNINEVSVSFEYKTETGDINETPKLDTTKPTPAPPTNPGGGPSGPSPCTPTKDCSYYYNLGQCGSGLNDGCNNILDCNNCNAGETCINNSCVALPFCSHDDNCTSLSGVCGSGLCNLTSRSCYINYLTGSICKNNVSECDEAEYCQNGLIDCPVDVNKTDGTICSIGICDGNGNCVFSSTGYGRGNYGVGDYKGGGISSLNPFIKFWNWFKNLFLRLRKQILISITLT